VAVLRVQLERHAEITAAVSMGDATWNDIINVEKEISRGLSELALNSSERGRPGLGEVKAPTSLELLQAKRLRPA
jgi:hypothetical protein